MDAQLINNRFHSFQAGDWSQPRDK